VKWSGKCSPLCSFANLYRSISSPILSIISRCPHPLILARRPANQFALLQHRRALEFTTPIDVSFSTPITLLSPTFPTTSTSTSTTTAVTPRYLQPPNALQDLSEPLAQMTPQAQLKYNATTSLRCLRGTRSGSGAAEAQWKFRHHSLTSASLQATESLSMAQYTTPNPSVSKAELSTTSKKFLRPDDACVENQRCRPCKGQRYMTKKEGPPLLADGRLYHTKSTLSFRHNQKLSIDYPCRLQWKAPSLFAPEQLSRPYFAPLYTHLFPHHPPTNSMPDSPFPQSQSQPGPQPHTPRPRGLTPAPTTTSSFVVSQVSNFSASGWSSPGDQIIYTGYPESLGGDVVFFG